MPAARYNLVIEQGATFQLPIIWKFDDSPVDLDTFIARLQIRSNPSDQGEPLLDLIDIDLDTGGSIEINISFDLTELIPTGEWYYDLVLTDSETNTVYRLLEGRAIVTPQVTHSIS